MNVRKILDAAVVSTCVFFVVGPVAAEIPTMQIPEPGTMSILGLGVGVLYLVSRHKRRK